MKPMTTRMGLLVLLGIAFLYSSRAQPAPPPGVGGRLQARVAALEVALAEETAARLAADAALQAALDALEANPVLDLGSYVSVDLSTINNLVGPHVIFEGANVHVRNASGSTETQDGLGNLVVGHNEEEGTPNRTGSHNLVVGPGHNYSSVGGFVAGSFNTISGEFASVSGGDQNEASGVESTVSGGRLNKASGDFSSVSGGVLNEASRQSASVSGGNQNKASGFSSTVSGGTSVNASGTFEHLP